MSTGFEQIVLIAPDSVDRKNAGYLRTYWTRIFGEELTITEVPETASVAGLKGAVFLGKNAVLKTGVVAQADIDDIAPDGYVVRSRATHGTFIGAGAERSLYITGARSYGTCCGVIGFLEALGCEFYAQGCEVVPTLAAVPTLDLADKPAWEFRRVKPTHPLCMHTPNGDIGDCREGLNPELFTKAAGSDAWIDHTAGYFVPFNLPSDGGVELRYAHPDYFAQIMPPSPNMGVGVYVKMKDGRELRVAKRYMAGNWTVDLIPLTANTPVETHRIGSLLPLVEDVRNTAATHRNCTPCLTHPAVLAMSAERGAAWVELQPTRRFFPTTYGDTGLFCTCRRCQEFGAPIDRVLNWVNHIVTAMKVKRPEITALALGYLTTMDSSAVKPDPSVIVQYAPWWGSATLQRVAPYFCAPKSIIAAGQMEGWWEAHPGNLGIYDYSGSHLQLRRQEREIPWMTKRGFRGMWECASPRNLTDLEGYVKARMLWGDERAPRQIEQAFCLAFYGPDAGPAVWSLINLAHKIWGGDSGDNRTFDQRYAEYGLRAYKYAIEVAEGTSYERRVDDATFHTWANKMQAMLDPQPEPVVEKRLHLSKSGPMRRSGFILDQTLTYIHQILSKSADAGAAEKLAEIVEEVYGARLTINASGYWPSDGDILVGSNCAHQLNPNPLITPEDVAAAKRIGGSIIRGRDGHIAMYTPNGDDSNAVDLFLWLLQQRHGSMKPKAEDGLLREFTLIDCKPWGAQPKPTIGSSPTLYGYGEEE